MGWIFHFTLHCFLDPKQFFGKINNVVVWVEFSFVIVITRHKNVHWCFQTFLSAHWWVSTSNSVLVTETKGGSWQKLPIFSGVLLSSAPMAESLICPSPVSCKDTHNLMVFSQTFVRSSCNLVEIPNDIPRDASIIMLRNNKIVGLKNNTFAKLKSCPSLSLCRNKLTFVMPGCFRGLKFLRKLELQVNLISAVEPGVWNGLRNLKILNLDHNQLATLTNGSFVGLPLLQKLHLEWNKISFIELGAFSGLGSLSSLFLNTNNLSNIRSGIFNGLSSLEILILQHNHLTSLSPNLFSGIPRPLTLFLSSSAGSARSGGLGNVWNCASLCWLKKEQQQRSINIKGAAEPRCTGLLQWKDIKCSEEGLLRKIILWGYFHSQVHNKQMLVLFVCHYAFITCWPISINWNKNVEFLSPHLNLCILLLLWTGKPLDLFSGPRTTEPENNIKATREAAQTQTQQVSTQEPDFTVAQHDSRGQFLGGGTAPEVTTYIMQLPTTAPNGTKGPTGDTSSTTSMCLL